MVSVRGAHKNIDERYILEQLDFEQWMKQVLPANNTDVYNKFKHVWDFCFENSAGSPHQDTCFHNAIEMIEILSTLNMDTDSLCAALLFPFLNSKTITYDDLNNEINKEVVQLVSGVISMKSVRQLRAIRNGGTTATQIDSIRRMLLAMVKDIRSVIIKLAERIMYLRNVIDASEEERVIAAKECFNIYAPLANRLGIGQLKWELEDFCFRYLHPKEYHEIAKKLHDKRSVRERYINDFVKHIQSLMDRDDIRVTVYGRPKHIYSIWRKMQSKSLAFDELYDIRAMRVIAERVEDCYAALGVIHTHYEHVAKEFDDYVAHPKPNGYQSIHTVIFGPQDQSIEIQIRTHQMHADAELGVAAHWKYKEGSTDKMSSYDQRIAWLRKLLSWQEEMSTNTEIEDEIKSQIFDDRVYVFTPKGDVVDLPSGSTPLDFAYHIHSDVGHRCIGAKIGGRIVPFTYSLKMGDEVEIITQKHPNPSRDWLNPTSGFVTSSRSRAKIHAWFKKQDREKNIQAGRNMLDTELGHLGLYFKDVDKTLLERYNARAFDEVYAGIGSGDIRINQLVNFLNSKFNKPTAAEEDAVALKQINQKGASNNNRMIGNNGAVVVEGVGNLLHTIARCCRPIPGDAIIGFITLGRGISIHRADCEQLIDLKNHASERIVEAVWGNQQKSSYTLAIRITAHDRSGLLRDITTILANEKVSIVGFASRSDEKQHLATVDMEIEVYNQEVLNRVITKINQMSDVLEVKRMSG